MHARKENNLSNRFTSCQVVQSRFTTYGLPISWSDLHCGVIVHVVKHLLIRVGFCSLFSAAIIRYTECKRHTFMIIMYHSSLFSSFHHSGIIFFSAIFSHEIVILASKKCSIRTESQEYFLYHEHIHKYLRWKQRSFSPTPFWIGQTWPQMNGKYVVNILCQALGWSNKPIISSELQDTR